MYNNVVDLTLNPDLYGRAADGTFPALISSSNNPSGIEPRVEVFLDELEETGIVKKVVGPLAWLLMPTMNHPGQDIAQSRNLQAITDDIEKQMLILPTLCDSVLKSGDYKIFVQAKFEQLRDVFDKYKLVLLKDEKDEYDINWGRARIICGPGMYDSIKDAKSFAWINVAGEQEDVASDFWCRHGTFSVFNRKLLLPNGKEVMLNYFVSFGYNKPVTREHFETRWTL